MRYRFGEFTLDDERFELLERDEPVHVEPQVFDVLRVLLRDRERVVSREELLDEVWDTRFVSIATLSSRIMAARHAIGDDGRTQDKIRTVRGRGFRFVADVLVEGGPTAAGRDAEGTGSAGATPSDGTRPGADAMVHAPRVRLIGRDADLDALEDLVRRHRLVTISGPGGAGKSTLAFALARRLADADGGRDIVVAELAPSRRRTDLVRSVAEASGVEGDSATSLGALASTLGSRGVLLVLDNCEHLLDDSAALVDAVLDAGPRARVLATSREPLRVDGEAVRLLGSLGADAPELFVERARSAVPQLEIDPGDAKVAALCDHLDGLPLAIELAAAQLRHLTLDDLVARLDDRLALMVGGRPRAGGRHSALSETIAWSHDLLTAASRQVFDRLGVFPATFDLDSVGAVTPELDELAVLRAIADLVAKNMVVHDHRSGRYHLLETIRLFADQQAAPDARAMAVERVRGHVAARHRHRSRSDLWLSATAAVTNRDDIGNVRLAFDACLAGNRLADAVDLTVAMGSLWRNAASYAEGRRWTDELAERDLAPADRLWASIIRADVGLGSGDTRLMLDSAEAALGLAQRVDDPAAAVIALVYRSLLLNDRRSIPGLTRARDAARAIGEADLERLARAFLAVASLLAGHTAGVDDEIDEVVETRSADGYDHYISVWAAWVRALAEVDGRGLRRWMDIQLTNVRGTGLGENWLTMFCHTLTLIGEGADHLGQLHRARRRAEMEGRRSEADCVLALGYAAACAGEHERAAELLALSATELFHDTANYVHHVVVRDLVVRPHLSEEALAAATERARGLTIETVLADHGL